MNILLTCSGRRSYLAEYFKEALEGEGKVFAANSVADAASMVVSDGAFLAPPLHKKGYADFLARICKKYEIKLLVPLFDPELPILTENRKKIEKSGAKIAVSSSEVVEICNDKQKTAEFLKSLGQKTLFSTTDIREALDEIKKGSLSFPLFIKSRWGTGSTPLYVATDAEELGILCGVAKRDINASFLKNFEKLSREGSVLIQGKAEGQEYGLDVINDFEGNHVAVFVKRKIAMRFGETDVAVTEDNKSLRDLGKKIGTRLKHCGILDVDVFWDGKQAKVLEMNARFGGGYPFSHIAGANIPKAYIKWAEKRRPPRDCFGIEYGIRGLKGLNVLRTDKAKFIL